MEIENRAHPPTKVIECRNTSDGRCRHAQSRSLSAAFLKPHAKKSDRQANCHLIRFSFFDFQTRSRLSRCVHCIRNSSTLCNEMQLSAFRSVAYWLSQFGCTNKIKPKPSYWILAAEPLLPEIYHAAFLL